MSTHYTHYKSARAQTAGLSKVVGPNYDTEEDGAWICYLCGHSEKRVVFLEGLPGENTSTFVCPECLFDLVRDGYIHVSVLSAETETTISTEVLDNGSVRVGDVAFAWS